MCELPLRVGGWRRHRIRSWAHPAVTRGWFDNMSGEDTRPQSPQPFSKCSFHRSLPAPGSWLLAVLPGDSFCPSGRVWLGTQKRQIRKSPGSVSRGLRSGLELVAVWSCGRSLCLGELLSLSCGMRCEVCGAKWMISCSK